MNRLLWAMAMVASGAAMAVTPVSGSPPTLIPVTINSSPGDQFDPHVSGEWAAYFSDIAIRYYNFATSTDAQIPLGGSAHDLLSDVSGSKVVFSRVIIGVKTAVMVFDSATAAAPIELDAAVGTNRIGSAIGNNTVAYIDFGLASTGELVIHDLVANTSVQITSDAISDQNPSVSPNGDVVTWEHCTTSTLNCDILQAVKSGAAWVVSTAAATSSPEANPDTNGSLVVYDARRSTDSDLFWRPVSGGPEVQLVLAGFQNNPSIAGNFIAFESRPTLFDTTDLFVYDLGNNQLYQITNTSLVTEQLNDITVLPDGRVRVVWASDEDGFDQRNIKGATFQVAAPPSCLNRNVVLDASRVYSPTQAHDASATITPAMSFALPASIPVTAGNAGNKSITLSFRLGTGQTTTCRYQSGSNRSHPSNAVELAKAANYNFERCWPNSSGQKSLRAGSIVGADQVTLHVAGGDSSKPSTAVRASLAEVCSAPVPPPCKRGEHGKHAKHCKDRDDDSDSDSDSDGKGHRDDDLSAAPDAKAAPMGCASAGGAPTVLMVLAVAAWLWVGTRAATRVAVRSRR